MSSFTHIFVFHYYSQMRFKEHIKVMCWPNLSNDTLVPPNTFHLRFMQSTSIKYKHAYTNKTQEQDILVGVKSFKLLNKHRCLMLLTFFTFLSILGQVWYSSEVKISEFIKEAQFMRKFKVQSSWILMVGISTLCFLLPTYQTQLHAQMTYRCFLAEEL